MKNFKSFTVLMIIMVVLANFSCKNSESAAVKNEELKVVESIKTPIVRGAGGRGMKIMLNIKKPVLVQLDSVVYNGRASDVSEFKVMKESVWFESFFYNEEKSIRGKGLVSYKAEGDNCQLYYSINEHSKSILMI